MKAFASRTRDGFHRLVFERQLLHLGLLGALLVPTGLLSRLPEVTEGALWGVSGATWFWGAVATAVLHQGYVWLAWRLELHGGVITRRFPSHGFRLFKAVFAALGFGRFLVVPLAVANQGTLELPPSLRWGLALVFLALSFYLFYSVLRYFGTNRAAGEDHFRPYEARGWPMVEEGVFRYTSNGMYVFGFLLLWVPGLLLESSGALVAAAFHHAYIWVHYHTTEKPDMERIYGG